MDYHPFSLHFFLGTFTSMFFSSLVWKCVHIAFTFDFWSFILMISSCSLFRSSFIFSQFALLYNGMFLGFWMDFFGLIFTSLVEDHPVFPKNVCKNLIWDRQPVWRTKSLNFNNTMIRTSYYLLYWLNFVADLLWLFRSFYRSSVGSFVERNFFIRILFPVYFDFT